MEDLAGALTVDALRSAWERVRKTDTTRGGVALDSLVRAVREGWYRPLPCFERSRRKPDGGVRALRIPRAPDRVLQLAVHRVASTHLDPSFRPEVHGFRPGRSPATALEHLLAQLDADRELLQVDLASMFDTLDHGRLRMAIGRAWDDPTWRCLNDAWMAAWPASPRRGVPQGAPLSPLLANLYLHVHLDPHVASLGHPWVRYADDLTLAVPPGGAVHALRALDGLVRRAGLGLARSKTRIAIGGTALAAARVLGRTVRVGSVAKGVEGSAEPWWATLSRR